MSVLAALTPPFLMAAVVVAAIVAFLRHEMGRGRSDRRSRGDNNSVPAPTQADVDADTGSDVHASLHRDS